MSLLFFLVVTPCGFCRYQHFVETCCLHLEDWRLILYVFQNLISTYESTCRCNLEKQYQHVITVQIFHHLLHSNTTSVCCIIVLSHRCNSSLMSPRNMFQLSCSHLQVHFNIIFLIQFGAILHCKYTRENRTKMRPKDLTRQDNMDKISLKVLMCFYCFF